MKCRGCQAPLPEWWDTKFCGKCEARQWAALGKEPESKQLADSWNAMSELEKKEWCMAHSYRGLRAYLKAQPI